MSSKLSEIIDRQTLRQMAGERYFERGEEYFSAGSVRGLVEHEGVVTAKVLGTRNYRVKLWAEGDELDYSCTCPLGSDGEFCKHCVAAGLTWLNPPKGGGNAARKPATTMEDVRSSLAAESKDVLVKMLMEQAVDDDRLRQRLLLKAATQGRSKIDLATYRHIIDEAADIDGYVDYRDAYDYAQKIDDAVESIQELLKRGLAAEVVELAEHALGAVEKAINSVDDSDGHMGGILERLQEIHFAACRKAGGDPEALARRLFQWEMNSGWGTFSGAAQSYARILGETGLAAYRNLAEAEWARVPERAPNAEDGYSAHRSRITRIMETLARQAGDAEAVVTIKKRDLSSSHGYLQIAEIYKQARKHDLALEWAEKGAKAFSEQPNSRLRDFLAEEYHRRKRHDEAMAIVWAQFADDPGLSGYRKLKGHADRTEQWPDWRDKALAFLKETLAKEKAAAEKSRWRGFPERVSSELVEIRLWERDVETAWQQAKDDGCSEELWLKLASMREAKHPDDALSVYQARIDPTLNIKSKDAYRQGVELLRKVHGLMARLGREAEFARYLDSVRADHKLKRNFIRLLDHARWK